MAERALRDQGPIRAGDRYRTLLPDYHFTVVYDAIGAEQPEALAYIALEFFERRDLFLVSRESGMAFYLVGGAPGVQIRFPSPERAGRRGDDPGSGVRMSLATGDIDMRQRLGPST